MTRELQVAVRTDGVKSGVGVGRETRTEKIDLDISGTLAPYSAVLALLARIEQEAPSLSSGARRETEKMTAILRREASDYGFGSRSTDGSAVAFAVLRRVSRESIYTARYIDSAAGFLAQYLAERAKRSRIILSGLDGVDRLSVKAILRALAKLPDGVRSSVRVAEGVGRPAAPQSDLREELVCRLSRELLGTEIRIGLSRVDRMDGCDLVEVAQNIVLQNFDREIDDSTADPEIFRLRAIAMVNVGRHEAALDYLRQAIRLSDSPTYCAHLHYLCGLVETKRHYDLDAAGAHYRRGIAFLESESSKPTTKLEYAWLLNGKALNAAMRYRRKRDAAEWETARALVFSAFERIGEEKGRAFDYLRFNLLANMALLYEMVGEFEVALEVFTQTFSSAQSQDMRDDHVGAHFCYRVAVLKAKLGEYDEAQSWLDAAYAKTEELECPFSRERVMRAELVVDAVRRQADGTGGAAVDALARGWALAAENFSSDGMAFYDGFDAARHAAQAEGDPRALFKLISPKLPAYIPEVDFEDLPKVDLNRTLSSASYAAGAA